MKPIEHAYLKECIRLIELEVGLGKIGEWKQRDYEKFSELLQLKTNVLLSLTTIKRILKEDIQQLPQKASLDALARFIGHHSWFDFVRNCQQSNYVFQTEKNKEKSRKQAKKDTKSGQSKKVYFLILSVFFILFVSYLFIDRISNSFPTQNIEPAIDSVISIDTLSGKKFKNLALTPPMGWNTWNSFGPDINENLIKEIADIMVKSGMRDAGYQYLIIDDGWQASVRDDKGNLQASKEKFPGGIKKLADYLHSNGLRLGLYSSAGTQSCKGLPGGRGHEFQDANTFALWGVDYLKYDWCGHGTADAPETYKIMRDAIFSAGRPMVYSLCEWGSNKPWIWAKEVGHLWRTTGNITDCLDCNETYAIGWKNILDKQVGLEKYAGPGHWNDPDMLEAGNPGLSILESKAHFSLWCMIAAPLIASNDLRNMSDETLKIFTNKDAISIDQDSLGKQGYRFSSTGGKEIWIKELSDENWAFCFLNTSKSEMVLTINWKDFPMLTNKEFRIYDIWQSKNIGNTKMPLIKEFRSNEIVFLKLSILK